MQSSLLEYVPSPLVHVADATSSVYSTAQPMFLHPRTRPIVYLCYPQSFPAAGAAYLCLCIPVFLTP